MMETGNQLAHNFGGKGSRKFIFLSFIVSYSILNTHFALFHILNEEHNIVYHSL